MKKLLVLLVISLIFSNLEVLNNKYCIMITESKVTEIFCIADDFCKEFEVVQSPTANANLCNLIEKTLLWSVEVNFLPWTTVEFLLYLHNSFV